jgi:hypothetical protein
MSEWRDEINRKALAWLDKALPDVFPTPVLTHAMGRRFAPPMPRLAIDSYWRAHPVRADRLARALSAKSGGPAGCRPLRFLIATRSPTRSRRAICISLFGGSGYDPGSSAGRAAPNDAAPARPERRQPGMRSGQGSVLRMARW